MANGFVATKIYGRIGNQFFMTAAAVALALRNNVEYYIVPKVESVYEPDYFKGCFPYLPSNCIIQSYHKEPSHAYTPIEYKPNMCLDSYYQSHKYWWDLKDKVLPLFNVNPIVKSDTIGIHKRLGDYRQLQEKHNLITDDYIKGAVKYYKDKGFSSFEVYSDEIELCKDLFRQSEFNGLHFTFSEGKTALEDLTALAGCAHQILSASTFSI